MRPVFRQKCSADEGNIVTETKSVMCALRWRWAVIAILADFRAIPKPKTIGPTFA